MRYLGHIKQVWSHLVQGDTNAMRKIDQATVKALELRAPRASTLDARALRGQLRGGEIFSAFSDRERDGIWSRLQMVDGLIPSLYTFFKDLQYLQVCVDCVKRLTRLSTGQSVYEAVERRFRGVNQTEGLVKVQTAEDNIISREGGLADQIDLGYRQIYAFSMRHYPRLPRETVGEDVVKQATAKADTAVLRRFADLASELGFDSPEITDLKRYPSSSATWEDDEQSRPLLVTTGPGLARAQRCGKPRSRAFEEDRNFLFIDHLHDERQDQSEGITSFFVRRSVYLAFFGRPTRTPSSGRGASNHSPRSPTPRSRGGSPPRRAVPGEPGSTSRSGTPDDMEQDIESILSTYGRREDAEQFEADPEEREREEQQRQERERQEQERQQQERLERERLEEERQERERQEQERQERERQEQEREEQERQEQERQEQERQEREKLAQDRLAREKQERERQERERQEREREEAQEMLERENQERERQEQERLEQERLEQERLEQERLEQERQERERQERERLEREKVRVDFKIWERGLWRDVPPLKVDPTDPSEVERIAKKYMRKKIRTLNTKLRMLAPKECFQSVIDDRTHTVLLIAQSQLVIDDAMLKSASKIHEEAIKRALGLKRVAADDISQLHAQKRQALNP